MTANQEPVQFTETQHAMLFGWMAKAVIEACGAAAGEAVLRKAVEVYGMERGGRMAQRARARDDDLTMDNYFRYGEWLGSPGTMEVQVARDGANLVERVFRCPWLAAWQESGLLPYGRVYCQVIDQALVRGFNPALRLDVIGTKSNGAKMCEFIFYKAGQTEPCPKPQGVTLPWEYHTAHLFATVGRVIAAELGETGQAAIAQALDAFAAGYGEAAARRIAACRDMDFTRPPAA